MCEFRPLNSMEKDAIAIAVRRGKIPADHELVACDDWQVSYEKMKGGFCVCVLSRLGRRMGDCIENTYDRYCVVYRGASRRCYKDKRNDLFGEMKAFGRAIMYSRAAELR